MSPLTLHVPEALVLTVATGEPFGVLANTCTEARSIGLPFWSTDAAERAGGCGGTDLDAYRRRREAAPVPPWSVTTSWNV